MTKKATSSETKAFTSYTMFDRYDGTVEVTFDDSTWINQSLTEDWDANIDEVNEWVCDEFMIETSQIDWRDPGTLWITE